MQLGTRWRTGVTPPAAVPDLVRATIADVEQTAESGTWTLTFLEGRAHAELDSGWDVLENSDGTVSAHPFGEDTP